MVLSLILRTERSIDILLRKVDHIVQMQAQIVQQSQMTTSPPHSESTVASSDDRLPQPVSVPHPVLVGDRLEADPKRDFLDSYFVLTESVTRGAGVTNLNDNQFWFSMPAAEPISIHPPQVVNVNPLFGNKARAAEYQFINCIFSDLDCFTFSSTA
jgi:hypothetical protein